MFCLPIVVYIVNHIAGLLIDNEGGQTESEVEGIEDCSLGGLILIHHPNVTRTL